ncbi:MAG: hypothetical protein Q4A51_06810 [Lachnospiraceae bacterium]|nr:hypothetical protein [Lachnospiraceae bacterium]
MKKILLGVLSLSLIAMLALAGCGNNGGGETTGGAAPSGQEVNGGTGDTQTSDANALADGVYIVDVDTGSNMFHINEAKEGKGELTVKNGEMTLHITLTSKKIVNCFIGSSEDAEKEGAELIEPTLDEVTYSDGMTDEVYGFDLPCPAIGEPFDVSIIGTHDNWYTHPVTVTNPVPAE